MVLCMSMKTDQPDQLIAEVPVDTVDELEAGIDERDILLPRSDRE